MSTLANTTWSVNCSGAGTQTVTFNADGTVEVSFPNGQVTKGNWAEAPDGHFMFQTPKSTSSPNINQVFFGITNGVDGSGHWNSISTILNSLTMKKLNS